MLFSCCFKKNKSPQSHDKSNLTETLIEKEIQKQNQIAKVKPSQDPGSLHQNESSRIEQKPAIPANQKLEQMKVIQSYSSVHSLEQDQEIESQSEKISASKTLIRMPSQEESLKLKKQSELWQQAGNKILYFVSQKDEQMVMTYKVSLRKVQSQLLDYVLKPNRFSSKFKNKPNDLSLSLILSSQSLSKLKGVITNLVPDPQLRPIFGVFKRENQQKLSKSHYEVDCYTHDIITVGNNCLRLQAFQRIVILLNSEKDVSSIMSQCQKITEYFQLQDIAKISFVFPAFLSLSEINAILSKINRKFLISQKLQKTINYLGYYVELFQHSNIEEAIIVSSIENIYKEDDKINKDFQIKLQLAIGLLMIEIDYNNAKLFSAIISNFLMDKTVSEYLKFIDFLHKDKKEFISKIQAMKLFDPEQLEEIQKSRRMEEKILNAHEKTITIKYRHKRKLGELFQEYHTTKTPVEQYERKKEWDDDLRENDISATIIDKPDKKIESSCNIFEVIDDSYVEKADLDILPDDDQMQFQQDD